MVALNWNAVGGSTDIGGVEPVPDGWYVVRITKSGTKETSKRDGSFLELMMEVIDGPYIGRVIFLRLNLWNPNPSAVEIATKTMNKLAYCVGRPQFTDSNEIHGIPFQCRVTLEQNQETKRLGNNVVDFKFADGTEFKATGQPGAPAAPPIQAGAPPAPPPAFPGAPAAGAFPAQPPAYAPPAGAPPAPPPFPGQQPQQPQYQPQGAPPQPQAQPQGFVGQGQPGGVPPHGQPPAAQPPAAQPPQAPAGWPQQPPAPHPGQPGGAPWGAPPQQQR